ncbi:MAG: IS66 family transposase [bacterium]|nr:IS66 family transposase [bacterium]
MSSHATKIEELKAQLVDRDETIAQLSRDLRALESAMKRMLASRRGGQELAEGQGLLFESAPDTEHEDSNSDEVSESAEDDSDDDADTPDTPKESGRPKSKPRGIDTSALPCEERIHELPEDERVCPDTGQVLVPVSEKVFEEIDYRRPKLVLIIHRQVIYGLPEEEAKERQAAPLTAPMPPRPLENCAASAILLAWLLVQKYANHLPLYRQEQIFARDGLRLPRQTLCDWVMGAADALQPIADYLMAKVRAGPVMQLDDTPVMCQGGRGEKNFQAYLWVFVNPEVGGVVYRFTSGRASDLLMLELGSFGGFLVGDGYSGNRAAANKVMKKYESQIIITGCWAHATRKFRDAKCEAAGTAQLFCDDIKRLYEIEREADESKLEPVQRQALRIRKSQSIMTHLFARARRMKGIFSDAGKMAEAIGYLRNQRRSLRRILENGLVPLDNNRCERSIRPIAVGRRNWLFAGSIRGGRAAATVYTLIECCRIAKVDIVSYLADVLVRVATHPASRIGELLPEYWAKAGAEAPALVTAQPALV